MSVKVVYWISAFCIVTYFSGAYHNYHYASREFVYLNITQCLINILAAYFYCKIANRYSLVKILLISILIGLASFITAFTVNEIFHTGKAQIPFTSRYALYFGRVMFLSVTMPTLYVNIFLATAAHFVFKNREP